MLPSELEVAMTENELEEIERIIKKKEEELQKSLEQWARRAGIYDGGRDGYGGDILRVSINIRPSRTKTRLRKLPDEVLNTPADEFFSRERLFQMGATKKNAKSIHTRIREACRRANRNGYTLTVRRLIRPILDVQLYRIRNIDGIGEGREKYLLKLLLRHC